MDIKMDTTQIGSPTYDVYQMWEAQTTGMLTSSTLSTQTATGTAVPLSTVPLGYNTYIHPIINPVDDLINFLNITFAEKEEYLKAKNFVQDLMDSNIFMDENSTIFTVSDLFRREFSKRLKEIVLAPKQILKMKLPKNGG